MLLRKGLLLLGLALGCVWLSGFTWHPHPYSPPERGLLEYHAFLERWIERGEEEFTQLGSSTVETREEVVERWRQRGLKLFRSMDANGDGVIDKKERLAHRERKQSQQSGG